MPRAIYGDSCDCLGDWAEKSARHKRARHARLSAKRRSAATKAARLCAVRRWRVQLAKQVGRQFGEAILSAFAILDTQKHARAVDVGDFERDHFGKAQAGAVGDAERSAVLSARRCIDQTGDLLRRQHRA
jgi:hypothetical protein